MKFLKLLWQWARVSIQQWYLRKHFSDLREMVRLSDLSQAIFRPPVQRIDPVPVHPKYPAMCEKILQSLHGRVSAKSISAGDSILAFLEKDLNSIKPRDNFNVPGMTSSQILSVLEFIHRWFPEFQPDVLVIGCGWGNEAGAWQDTDLMEKNFLEMLDGARGFFPRTKIVHYSAPPVTHPWAILNRARMDSLGKEWVRKDINSVYLDLLVSLSGKFQLFPQTAFSKDNVHATPKAGFRIDLGIQKAIKAPPGSVVLCPELTYEGVFK